MRALLPRAWWAGDAALCSRRNTDANPQHWPAADVSSCAAWACAASLLQAGDVLVFANQKARVDELAAALQGAGARCGADARVALRGAETCGARPLPRPVHTYS